jgi:hypothetical protein
MSDQEETGISTATNRKPTDVNYEAPAKAIELLEKRNVDSWRDYCWYPYYAASLWKAHEHTVEVLRSVE